MFKFNALFLETLIIKINKKLLKCVNNEEYLLIKDYLNLLNNIHFLFNYINNNKDTYIKNGFIHGVFNNLFHFEILKLMDHNIFLNKKIINKNDLFYLDKIDEILINNDMIKNLL